MNVFNLSEAISGRGDNLGCYEIDIRFGRWLGEFKLSIL